MMKPVHPGEVLAEDFLEPMGLSQYRLAKEIKVPLRRVNEIVLGRRGMARWPCSEAVNGMILTCNPTVWDEK